MMDNTTIELEEGEIGFKEILQQLKSLISYLRKQWWRIALIGLVGGTVGFLYAWMQPVTYTAKTVFVVEDAKSGGGLSGLASLAGQFGVDLGSGGGGGLIAGDNILLYFKSESLSRQVLLSPWDSSSTQSVADRLADIYQFQEKWVNNKAIGRVSFPIYKSGVSYTRLQDSLLNFIIKNVVLQKSLSISKLEKKSGFIQLSITLNDELLAKRYCDLLVDIAVKRYVQIKTLRQQSTVNKLQFRADSIASLLMLRTSKSAELQTTTSTMDINPLYKVSSIANTEMTMRDKTMLTTVYAEIIKNLELAKFSLSQETPVIQIVDSPTMPLFKKRTSKILYSIFFSFIFTFLAIVYFYLRIWSGSRK